MYRLVTPLALLALASACKQKQQAPSPEPLAAAAADNAVPDRVRDKRAAAAEQRGWCSPWITDAMVTAACGEHAALQVARSAVAKGWCALEVADGENIVLGIKVSKSTSDAWSTDVVSYPPDVKVEPYAKGGGETHASAFPYLVYVGSGGPDAACDAAGVDKLARAILAAAPDKATAPAVNQIMACDELLTATDIKQACGEELVMKPTGMADDKWNVCNSVSHGGALIFILTRHSDASRALSGAKVASEDDAPGEDGKVHVSNKNGRTVAVAPVDNLLLELKSTASGAHASCGEAQLEKLAGVIVSRLRS